MGHKPFDELQCAHFHSRRKESVRFDPRNAVSLCIADHQYFDTTAEGKRAFEKMMIQRLGQREFDLLQLAAETPQKKDDVMMKLYVRELLKGLE